METEEAQKAAAEFLEEFPTEGFATTETLVAAAILYGENIGAQRMRRDALRLMQNATNGLYS